MKKKYLFFDIDGTLVAGGADSSFIPESTLLALDLLKKAGHFLCIATGRSEVMARDFMEKLQLDNMVSDGGYGVTIDGKLLFIKPLDRIKAIELYKECEAKGYPWGLQIDNSKIRLVPDERFIDFTHDVYIKTEVRPGLDPNQYPEIYKMYIACYEPKEQELEALKSLPWCRYHKEYLFVEPTDKAYGIKRIMDHLGADYKDVIVFGDNNNDLSMFTDDWFKVAMGNATEKLKEKADYITADINEDGIYRACEYLHLFDQAE